MYGFTSIFMKEFNMREFKLDVIDKAGWLATENIREMAAKYSDLLERVKKGEEEYRDNLGWHDVQQWAGDEWLDNCQKMAEIVQQDGEVLVVIGIGGSNQAARAVIDSMGTQNHIKVLFAGNNISADSILKILDEIEGKSVYINVIAKNFETLEPGIGFRVLRTFLRETYGEEYAGRVICTGTYGTRFEELAHENGYHFIPFPDDVGGRYTGLTPVGLFPLAAAGFNIYAMARGARHMSQRLQNEDASDNIALKYAIMRNMLYEKGFKMEMLSCFEPRMFRFAKWWMQLFGESEGKDNKGLYPVYGNFSEDLHSVGQFLQDGSTIMFETFLQIEDTNASYILHNDDVEDGFSYLDGMDFNEINRAAFMATVSAHSEKFPCLILTIPAIDEETFGQLFYFYQFMCYLSAEILGVNPFNQPGVEAYKHYMFKTLGK
mgnify:FL=1